jgi:hypothetical protein
MSATNPADDNYYSVNNIESSVDEDSSVESSPVPFNLEEHQVNVSKALDNRLLKQFGKTASNVPWKVSTQKLSRMKDPSILVL